MNFKRWLPTFLAFPLGGLLASRPWAPSTTRSGGRRRRCSPGAIIGAGQWLALRSRGIGLRWIAATGAAMAAGAAARRGR